MSDFPPEASQHDATALVVPSIVGWSLGLYIAGIYTTAHIGYVRSSMYKRIAWPVKTVLHLVFVLIYIYQGFVIAQLCYWTSTQDRSSDHFLNGQPFESAPPLIFGIIAALVQSLLGVRVTSLIPRRKWRYIFGGVLAAMIAFALTSATLVFAVNTSGLLQGKYNYGWVNFNSALAASLWSNCVIDLTISIALAYTLRRRVAGFNAQTDSLLTRLAIIGLQTAAYTTFISLGGAIAASMFASFDPVFAFVTYAFWPLLPTMYGCSVYTTLSTRRTVDEYIGSGPIGNSLPIPGSREHGVHDRTPRNRNPSVFKPSLVSSGKTPGGFDEGGGARDVSSLRTETTGEEKGKTSRDEVAQMV